MHELHDKKNSIRMQMIFAFNNEKSHPFSGEINMQFLVSRTRKLEQTQTQTQTDRQTDTFRKVKGICMHTISHASRNRLRGRLISHTRTREQTHTNTHTHFSNTIEEILWNPVSRHPPPYSRNTSHHLPPHGLLCMYA